MDKEEALRIFTSYADVFSSEENSLGRTTKIQHQILTCDDMAVNQRHRRIHRNQLAEVKQHLQDLLDKGVIGPSQSNRAIVLVRKKNGALGMRVDYRQLNAKVKRDAYPLPRRDESLDILEVLSTSLPLIWPLPTTKEKLPLLTDTRQLSPPFLDCSNTTGCHSDWEELL